MRVIEFARPFGREAASVSVATSMGHDAYIDFLRDCSLGVASILNVLASTLNVNIG